MASAPTSLSVVEVARLAQLARLELTPGERARYAVELTGVLTYVAKLQEFPVAPAGAAVQSSVELRQDAVAPWVDPGALVAAAAEHEGELVKVPPVFGNRSS